MAVAEQTLLVARLQRRQFFRVKPREGAQTVGGVKIHHQQIHHAIGAGLQLEAAFDP